MNGKIFGNSLVKAGFVAFALALGLAACGDGGSTNGPSNNHEDTNISSVESEENLPSCTESREGFVNFINGTKEGFVCKNRRWNHYDMIADVEENLPGCTGSREGLSAYLYEEDRELNCVEGSWDVVGEVATSSSSEKSGSSSSREKDGSSSSVAPNSSSSVIPGTDPGSSSSVVSSSSSSVIPDSDRGSSSSSAKSSSSVASSSSSSVIPGTDPESPSSSSEKDDSSSSVALSSSSVILSSSSEESSSSVASSSSVTSSSSVASSSSSSVIPGTDPGSSSSVASSSSAESSSSSVILSSSSEGSSSSVASSSSEESSSSVTSSSSVASSSSSSVIPDSDRGSSSSKANWAYLNPNIDYGEFTDERDGQVYKTIVICDKDNKNCQTWMAQNLNYAPTNVSSMGRYAWSGCYDNQSTNCSKYGRLYTWEVAMDSADCAYGRRCNASLKPATPVRGVCPSGWHLPSHYEFEQLINFIDPTFGYSHTDDAYSSTAGQYLKSLSGWKSSGNGSDAYGFSALPGGSRDDDGYFNYAGNYAYFWSSGEHSSSDAFSLRLYYDSERAYLYYRSKNYARSVRCLKD